MWAKLEKQNWDWAWVFSSLASKSLIAQIWRPTVGKMRFRSEMSYWRMSHRQRHTTRELHSWCPNLEARFEKPDAFPGKVFKEPGLSSRLQGICSSSSLKRKMLSYNRELPTSAQNRKISAWPRALDGAMG